jgi:hypothetical protein
MFIRVGASSTILKKILPKTGFPTLAKYSGSSNNFQNLTPKR